MQCSNHFPSFGRFEWVPWPFWAKKGCFGAESAQFWEGTSQIGATASGRHRLSFWLKTWIRQGHHLGSRMAREE